MSTLAEWLLEQIAEDETWAREASRHRDEPLVDGGEHWRWECPDDHVVAVDTGVDFMQCPLDESWGMSLRSVEQYPYRSIAGEGPSIHLTVDELSSVVAGHIARHDPARVLAECEAKRRIVGLSWHHLGEDDYAWGMEEAKRQILALLALPYADRPGYRDEWRP